MMRCAASLNGPKGISKKRCGVSCEKSCASTGGGRSPAESARAPLLPPEDRAALLQHGAAALARVGALAGAPRGRVEVGVGDAVAERDRALDGRLDARERERRVARDALREMGGRGLQFRRRDDLVD